MTRFEDKISLMIPAYLRGELSEPERQEIEKHAAENPDIAADIEFQRNLKSAIKPNQDAFEPGELGWAKLSKAMSETDVAPDFEGQRVSQPIKFWKYAAAVLAFAAIGQAGVLGSLAMKTDQDAQYLTVSETPANIHTIKIGFNNSVTAEQITQTLKSLNAEIISGPSALELYDVRFKSASACTKAVQNFEARPNIIESATSCE